MQPMAPAETRTVLENILWETYVDLAEQRRGSVPRMTYDEGVLAKRFDLGETAIISEFRASLSD